MSGVDDDPLNDACGACGAEPTEECRVGCLDQDQHVEEASQ